MKGENEGETEIKDRKMEYNGRGETATKAT